MLNIILAPVLGGIIGYITNDLAIKMLFHPHRPVYIGKWHVPFTPGLIPSQKQRIAKSLGNVISSQLLDAQTIREEALSENTRKKMRDGLVKLLEKQASDERKLRERIGAHVPAEKIEEYEKKLVDGASDMIMDKLRASGIGAEITAQISQALQAKLGGLGLSLLLRGNALEGIEQAITNMINTKIEEKGPEMIRSKLNAMEKDLMDKRICDLTEAHMGRIDLLADAVMELYEGLMVNHLEGMLAAAGIDKIIENKIASFDAAQLEKLIFGIMKKELKAIVYLGAVLGFLMGFINLIF